MGAFIEAIDLHKTYRVGKIDVPALRGVSFAVEKGEFVTVVGASVNRKSTVFYLLGGLTRADSGKVVMDGDDFATHSHAQAQDRLRISEIQPATHTRCPFEHRHRAGDFRQWRPRPRILPSHL